MQNHPLRLALQVHMSGEESKTCNKKMGETVETKQWDFLFMDWEIMTNIRQGNNPAQIYRSEVRQFNDKYGDDVYHYTALNGLCWHACFSHRGLYWYSIQRNFQRLDTSYYFELLWFLSLLGMLCGNHRQGAEFRVNKVHD